MKSNDIVKDFIEKESELSSYNFKTYQPNMNSEEDIGNIYISEPFNNVANIESLMEELYAFMHPENYLLGYAETIFQRKKRILRKYISPLNYLYYALDFIITRVSPKIRLTKNLYFKISNGKRRVLSKTEILGKLYYYGFTLKDEFYFENIYFFIVAKVENHCPPNYKPKEGVLITLPRIGKNGKLINVYKFRTMHPYAEFIQNYVYQKNELQEGGKLKDDFRIHTLGKFMRKYWIDELPMILNLLKADLKLVGVRPLSQHYFSLYSKELQELRLKTKPGLLPPFYVDMPKTLEEIQASERKYLEAHATNPFRTDIHYFFMILNTIILKGRRSE